MRSLLGDSGIRGISPLMCKDRNLQMVEHVHGAITVITMTTSAVTVIFKTMVALYYSDLTCILCLTLYICNVSTL